MKSSAPRAVLAALFLALGCSSGGLKPDGSAGLGGGGAGTGAAAGSGGGAGSTGTAGSDGGGPAGSGGGATAGSDGGAPDGPEVPTFTGRRAFKVQSTVKVVPTMFTSSVPETHAFTLVLDGDTGMAIAGSADGINAQAFKTSDGRTFEIGPLGFAFPDKCVSSLIYSSATITVTSDGVLTGSGSGTADWSVTDELAHGTATMTLAGVPDDEPPGLAIVSHSDPSDPFFPVALVASEPLPPDTSLVLTSGSGDSFPLVPSTSTANAHGIGGFKMPAVLLRFGETYVIQASQITDFVGHHAQANFQLATRVAPPLVPEDGFESTVGPNLGSAQVITGTAYPVIAGTKSLYIPILGGGPGERSQLMLRLGVKPGDKVIRFSYRTIVPTADWSAFDRFAVASVGKTITTKDLPTSNAPKTAFKLPDGSTVYLGPLSLAELPLPADVSDEVVLDHVVGSFLGCGAGYSNTSGLIIDDLRVE